jgi:hypothetical protein
VARTVAELPTGTRLTDYISLGVLAKTFPVEVINRVLAETGTASVRQRELPAHVVIYYVIALALYMQVSYREVLRCVFEGLQWILGEGAVVKITGKSGISQARTRLGAAPVQKLYEAIVAPIAVPATKGAWYRQWRLVTLDGTTLDVADTVANVAAFGRPGASRGASAFPQLRVVALVENGTHVLCGAAIDAYAIGETTLARRVWPTLQPGMLCLADRTFFGWTTWTQARARGADLLWRIKKNLQLPVQTSYADGSYQSVVYSSLRDRRHQTNGLVVRVIDYHLEGVPDAEPLYRLVTTLLDPVVAPAVELAALYHERWEIETALAELKTHLRGARIVLRSKTPDLVRQEFYGLLLAHFAVRSLMHDAALSADTDPDRLSFVHAVRVVRRKLSRGVAIPPSGQGRVPPSGTRGTPR